MPPEIADLQKMIDDLKKVNGVRAAVIVDRKGTPIVSGLPENFNLNLVSTMSALLFDSAEMALTGGYGGKPEKIIIESAYDKILLVEFGPKALIATIIEPTADINIITRILREEALALGHLIK
jgi:predicted regulator of Ras-like GTPase activity (Roadblock/LC7/MglB family)